MEMERFNLQWPSYTNHLSLMFRDLYSEAKYQDVTLICDDHTQLKAHKTVLSAFSPVFRSILGNHQQIHPIIFLRGIQYLEMELILKFMYFGETTVFLERSEEFLRVARDLEMSELCDLHAQHCQDLSQDGNPESPEENEPEEELEAMLSLSETLPPPLPSSAQYICQRCGVRYVQSPGLPSNRNKTTLLYFCNFCEEKFQQKWRLSKHVYHLHHEFQMICKKGNCSPKLLQKQ